MRFSCAVVLTDISMQFVFNSFSQMSLVRHLSTFPKDFFCETTKPISIKFHMELQAKRERRFIYLVQVTRPKWLPCPSMVKTLKLIFFKTTWLID